MNFWQDKKVLVTGGNGFLGSYMVKKLTTLWDYQKEIIPWLNELGGKVMSLSNYPDRHLAFTKNADVWIIPILNKSRSCK